MVPLAASAQEPCLVSVPVVVDVAGVYAPSDVPYTFVMGALTVGAPMPETAELLFVNPGNGSFPPITYSVPGDYQYRVRQTTQIRDRFTFDTSVYTVTIRIINQTEGGLGAEIWAVNGDGSAKTGTLSFTNTYSGYNSGSIGGGSGGGGATGHRAVLQDGLTIIDENQTPLAGALNELIPNSLVPLAGLPKTGDTTKLGLWVVLAVLSGIGLCASGQMEELQGLTRKFYTSPNDRLQICQRIFRILNCGLPPFFLI